MTIIAFQLQVIWVKYISQGVRRNSIFLQLMLNNLDNIAKTEEIWGLFCPKYLSEFVQNTDYFVQILMFEIEQPEIFGN